MIPEMILPEHSLAETYVSQDDVYKYYSQRGGKLNQYTYAGIVKRLFPTEDLPSQKAPPRNPSEIAARSQANRMIKRLLNKGHEASEQEIAGVVTAYVYARTADKPDSSEKNPLDDQQKENAAYLSDQKLFSQILYIRRLNSEYKKAYTVSTQVFPVFDRSSIAA